MIEAPVTRYARAPDGTFIAFQVFGAGSVDVLLMPGYFTNVDENWRFPEIADVIRRLASFARVIVMDRRGVGLSDRMAPGQSAPLETHVDDLVAVLEAAKAHDVCLISSESGTALAVLFAAAHPERVRSLALYMPFPCSSNALGGDPIVWTQVEEEVLRWGDDYARGDLEEWAPSVSGDPATVQAWGAYLRASGSPGSAVAVLELESRTDIRSVLPFVRCPTLILTRPAIVPAAWAERWIREAPAITQDGIPDTRLVELAGRDLPFWFGDRAAFVAELEEFFAGTRTTSVDARRSLATVLFTDIVDSTSQAAAIGDRRWRIVRERHDQIVRSQLARYRGREIKTMGDGFLATFDGPARGVRCARAIAEAVRAQGIEIRAGLHTGEVELDRDDVSGIAVAIGARLGALASPSEILVSSTVKDLVAGSGLGFEDAGKHELKGVPDQWHLYRAVG